MKNFFYTLCVFICVQNTCISQNDPCSAPTMYLNSSCAAGDAYFNEFNTTLAGTSTINATCSTGNETTEKVTWVKFTATTTSITVTNSTNYAGPGAADIEDKDFAIFSGSCGALTQVGCAAAVNGSGGTATFTGLTAGTTYWMMTSHSDNSLAQGCAGCNVAVVCITSTTPSILPANPCNACTSPCSLTTNATISSYNGNATADAFICSGSVENNVWYNWCAPATWPAGQIAYISVYDQFCTSSSGIQLTVWNIGNTCPTAATNANVVCQNPGATTSYYYQWTAVANTCYRVVIDGFGGTVCSFNLTVGSVTVLPISLASFEATKKESSVIVNWSTSSQKNNKMFVVEKSQDNMVFEAFAEIAGAGTSNAPLNYSSTDSKPFKGVSYYRLKQIDYDGNFSYSKSASIENIPKLEPDFNIIPNPNLDESKTEIIFNQIPVNDVNIFIYDINGNIVYQDSKKMTQTAYALPVELATGIYIVKAFNTDFVITKRMLIR